MKKMPNKAEVTMMGFCSKCGKWTTVVEEPYTRADGVKVRLYVCKECKVGGD